MFQTAFEPLSDAAFRQLVASGAAVPGREGSVLLVSKWRDGPGLEVETFLTALRAEGSTLEARTYKKDVNVRVVRTPPKDVWGGRSLPSGAKGSA
jgi:hypothetical protein